jgi:cyclophilin family peptidyl-prolyl cis-trans isomerase
MPTNKRERQRENRAKKREEQQKLERQRKLRKRATQIALLVGLLAIALLVPMLFSNSGDSTTTTTPSTTVTTPTPTTLDAAALPADYDGYRAQPTACGAEAPPPRTEMSFDAAEDQGIAPDAVVTATITTSCGEIIAQLDPAIAPETVNSFVFLAREGYFDGSAFHRIVPGFVIQGGDPTAVGNGGPGYLVPDEFPEPGFVYSRGVLAMANGGANSTGSQFFVVTGEDAGLDPLYSVFGTVTDSDETLDRISAVRLTGRDGTENTEPSLPLETVYIEKIEIEISG